VFDWISNFDFHRMAFNFTKIRHGHVCAFEIRKLSQKIAKYKYGEKLCIFIELFSKSLRVV
jgi:hypothetical protein